MISDQRAQAEYEQKRENGDHDSKSDQHGVPHSTLQIRRPPIRVARVEYQEAEKPV
jgi:hypothetical protein